jgi:hypothetical protein
VRSKVTFELQRKVTFETTSYVVRDQGNKDEVNLDNLQELVTQHALCSNTATVEYDATTKPPV